MVMNLTAAAAAAAQRATAEMSPATRRHSHCRA